MDEPLPLPTSVNYGIRRIKNIIKQTVRLLPNIRPQNQKVRVDLPIGTVDLSTFIMSYYAWTTPRMLLSVVLRVINTLDIYLVI